MAGARGGLFLAVGLGAVHAAPALTAVLPRLRPLLGVGDRLDGERGFALTFDDGPHPQGTPEVLAELDRLGVQATFFLVGEQVLRYPSLAAEIAAAGHRVGVHCFSHRNLLARSPRRAVADIKRAEQAIAEATGIAPALYRPPYGVLSAAALAYAHTRGWRTYLWTAWGRDWEATATPASIARLLLRSAGPGGVGLLHDADHYSAPGSHRKTAAALGAICAGLAERGLAPRPL